MKLILKSRKKAQSLIEYALILAMVAVVAIAALQLLGNNIGTTLQNAANTVGDGAGTAGENACKAMGEDNFEWDGSGNNGKGVCRYKHNNSNSGTTNNGDTTTD